MTVKSNDSWKTIAILLVIALGIVIFCTGLIVTGVMNLGLSLL
jgi:hypothetical protein